MMYRYCQLKRHFAWEIMKYLKSHPEVIAVNDKGKRFEYIDGEAKIRDREIRGIALIKYKVYFTNGGDLSA